MGLVSADWCFCCVGDQNGMIGVKITREENASFYGVSVGDIVQVPFETYVAGVVASEIGNSAVEACKAQAVAARTFAISKGVLNGKPISDSSSAAQAFRASRIPSGLYPNAEQGAQETAGEIVTYQDSPINAVYSACNGGRTVSSQERWGGVRPYLIAFDDCWDNSTKRIGHGVGMSQRGAKYAASIGKDYKEILLHYYPGTEIKQLDGGDGMTTAAAFVDKVWIPLNEGWGYIYGTWGSLWTQEKQNQATREQTVKYGSKWIGKYVTDCSGLIRWALKQLGIDIVHHATYQYTDWCNAKGKLINGKRDDGKPILPGTEVFLQGKESKIHHCGVYVGEGICIEAKGTISGVVTSELSHWDHWGELKMLDYTNAADMDVVPSEPSDAITKAEVTNPGRYLNVRSGPGTGYQIVFRVDKGTIVDVLAQEVEWWQIRSGGRIGWAMAEYLTPLNDENPEETPDFIPEEEPEEQPGYIAISPEEMNELINITNSLNDLIQRIGGRI